MLSRRFNVVFCILHRPGTRPPQRRVTERQPCTYICAKRARHNKIIPHMVGHGGGAPMKEKGASQITQDDGGYTLRTFVFIVFSQ